MCLQWHLRLRRDFSKLSQATQDEFVKRMLSGWKKNYWQVVQGDKMTKLCRPGGGAHFLPAGYVLKDPQGSNTTKARLILDPSQCFNQTLVKPANIEKPIGAVLRRIQALPVAPCQDISVAFFRLKLDESSSKQLCFLMQKTRLEQD